MRNQAFGARTDTGRHRDVNEDAFLVLPEHGVYAVADGVGGQNSGEVASRKATGSIEKFMNENPVTEANGIEGRARERWIKDYFQRCIQKANAEILREAKTDPSMNRMATTLVLCYLDSDNVYSVNLGDSRAYIMRDGIMTQLTEDHTYVNKLVNAGTLTKSEARIHPQKNIITKALGAAKNTEPDFYKYKLQKGDRLMLCSDGLHGELADAEIASILRKKGDLNMVCSLLVDAANERGGHDNVTVVCVDNK